MARTKQKYHRGYVIILQSDDRYDVFEHGEYDPIAENFEEISLAIAWIDETQFD